MVAPHFVTREGGDLYTTRSAHDITCRLRDGESELERFRNEEVAFSDRLSLLTGQDPTHLSNFNEITSNKKSIGGQTELTNRD